MRVLSHRGYWKTAQEKNTPTAFTRSFDLDFGTETDVRDSLGRLVISHDMPDDAAMPLSEVLGMAAGRSAMPLAINVKADGLANDLRAAFEGSPHEWFVFDMSVPDMRKHLDAGNPVFARMSEVELNPPWLDEVVGIWLDAFGGDWYGPDLVRALLRRKLRVCVVSPELHRRDPRATWDLLHGLRDEPGLMLCTDLPEEAKQFFL